MKPAYHNAFLWGIGNGLFSMALVTYLIRDIVGGQPTTAVNATIAWIVAAPRIAGVLRLLTPTFINLFGNRKFFCVTCYILAPLVLGGIPLLLPNLIHGPHVLTMLVVFWCVYHLVEYVGTVALLAWLGDLVPEQNRGRFFGCREAWLVAGQTIGFLGVGLYSWGVIESMPKELPRWLAYLLPAYCGLGFFLASVVPLLVLRDDSWTKSSHGLLDRLREMLRPMRNGRFLAFILFGSWVQLSIGLTQATQHRFSIFTLGITMLPALFLSTTTRIGQWSIGSRVGELIDRFGNLRIMSWSLFVVSFGSLMYVVAEPSTWWLLFGAAILWIFWVGVNIGISKTILDLAPPTDRAAYFALYFAVSTLALALSTLFGGYLFAAAQFDRLLVGSCDCSPFRCFGGVFCTEYRTLPPGGRRPTQEKPTQEIPERRPRRSASR